MECGKGGMSVLELGIHRASGVDIGKGRTSVSGMGKGGASALVLLSSLPGLGESLLAFLLNFNEPTLQKLSLGPFSFFLLVAIITAALLLSQLLKGSAILWSWW